MTLKEARELLQKRVEIDQDSDEDLTLPETATAVVMTAARQVSRLTYFLFTERAALTLSDTVAKYNLLDPAICELPIFDLRATETDLPPIYVNGQWVSYEEWGHFRVNYEYHSNTSQSNPSCFTIVSPSHIIFSHPINGTAADASDNFASGFYLHTPYTWQDNQDTELLGPEEYHELIIDRAALNITKSYIDGEGITRWQLYNAEYQTKGLGYRKANLEMYRPLRRKGQAGQTRRVFGIGSI